LFSNSDRREKFAVLLCTKSDFGLNRKKEAKEWEKELKAS
jgi:hypothetical protein